VVLPTLGEERKATYSPFLPICQRTGQVLQVPITHTDPDKGIIQYTDPDTGDAITSGIDKGKVKLQWKCDWAMRWYALGVDYEMSGKDLSESVKLSSKITNIMGGTPPSGFSYELFLDQNGEKISKSRGNGLSVEEWLTYGTAESLSLFMYNQPKRAKRLYFDVVPKMVDEYYSHLSAYARQDQAAQIDNPIWHIHKGEAPATDIPVSFSLLLNLAGVCQAETAEVIWGYLAQYASDVSPDTHPELARLVDYAVTYYQDMVRPSKHYRQPTEDEIGHLRALASKLAELPDDAAAEDIQSVVFAIGKDAGYEPLRDWFSCLYQVLLGQDEGPRMGSFIKLYGRDAMQELIMKAVNGDLAGEAG
ncbi:MAG: lysine--tRNA ligase, partial [Candidatus Puniceispirillales bacterium]